jgi:hypothetical protein
MRAVGASPRSLAPLRCVPSHTHPCLGPSPGPCTQALRMCLRVHSDQFAKGPCYFLSRELAAEVSVAQWVHAEAEAALKPVRHDGSRLWPWEDTFLGMALSHIAAAPVTVVHISGHVFSEHENRFAIANSTLVWHDKRVQLKNQAFVSFDTRIPERLTAARDWLRSSHCNLQRLPPTCHGYVACGGTQWTRCLAQYATGNAGCSTRLVDLPNPPPLRSRSFLAEHGVPVSRTLPVMRRPSVKCQQQHGSKDCRARGTTFEMLRRP